MDEQAATAQAQRSGPSWRGALAWPLVVLVRLYQRWISPALPATCRFYPSCSAYGLTALQRFGPFTGTWLMVKRVARCHPWNPGGVDHVPERETARPRSASQGDAPHPAHVIAKDD